MKKTTFGNKQYIKSRDKLIPLAASFADKKTDGVKGDKWAKEFFIEMDRLAVEIGIQERRYHPSSEKMKTIGMGRKAV